MRKLILQQWLSMDGYAADENNSVSFIESISVNRDGGAETSPDTYSDQEQLEWLHTIDTILLGANTYKLFVDFWPTATIEQEVVADAINTIPKIIFSNSLKKAPWGKWPEASVMQDAVKTVGELKQKQGKDMVLWGSISLSQDLIKANLVDEYHFRIVPLVLGKGRPQFESTGPLQFDLYDTKRYESGLMLLKYRRR